MGNMALQWKDHSLLFAIPKTTPSTKEFVERRNLFGVSNCGALLPETRDFFQKALPKIASASLQTKEFVVKTELHMDDARRQFFYWAHIRRVRWDTNNVPPTLLKKLGNHPLRILKLIDDEGDVIAVVTRTHVVRWKNQGKPVTELSRIQIVVADEETNEIFAAPPHFFWPLEEAEYAST